MINSEDQRVLLAKQEEVVQQPTHLKTPNIASFSHIHRPVGTLGLFQPHAPGIRTSDVTKIAPPVAEIGTMSQLNEKRRHSQSDQTAHPSKSHSTQVAETITFCALV
jgi:hypothetical protein